MGKNMFLEVVLLERLEVVVKLRGEAKIGTIVIIIKIHGIIVGGNVILIKNLVGVQRFIHMQVIEK